MKEIRFAAIPKCASRSLAAVGLCGELYNKRHSKVTEYPHWQDYEWYYIDRDPEDWYRSWWLQSKSENSPFAIALGMAFESFEEDFRCFANVQEMGKYEREIGFNCWIPRRDAFIFQYGKFQALGLDFKAYCFATIMDGVPCKQVHLSRLDAWLVARGFNPVHMNAKQIYRGLTKEEYFNPHPDLMALAQKLKATNQLSDFMKILGELVEQAPINGVL